MGVDTKGNYRSEIFQLNSHSYGFHYRATSYSILTTTTGKYCSSSFHLNGHT